MVSNQHAGDNLQIRTPDQSIYQADKLRARKLRNVDTDALAAIWSDQDD